MHAIHTYVLWRSNALPVSHTTPVEAGTWIGGLKVCTPEAPVDTLPPGAPRPRPDVVPASHFRPFGGQNNGSSISLLFLICYFFPMVSEINYLCLALMSISPLLWLLSYLDLLPVTLGILCNFYWCVCVCIHMHIVQIHPIYIQINAPYVNTYIHTY